VEALPPRESVRADICKFNPMISIVNPSSSFSIAATINGVPVTFLLDTGSALTILNKTIWDISVNSLANNWNLGINKVW